jgi:hypothetical protein
VSSKWSLFFRFHYQNLICLSPHTCHMPCQSHPQVGDFRSPAIMLCAWVIALLLGKVWASHSIAKDSGLVVCDFFKDWEVHSKRHRVHIPQDISSALLLLQEIADASLNV